MKIKIFLSTLAFSLVMVACSERTEGEITANNYQANSAQSLSKVDKASVSFTFRLGRVSKNCGGFGVCELSALGVTIVEGPVKITVTHNLDSETPDFALKGSYELNSAEQLDGLDDTTFYVDQDFYSSDQDGVKYVFHKGEYTYDPTIGKFGGYAIQVTTL
ncbi:MAG: hypothetical protein EOO44_19970 [Flavobacterium sp.]|nr:MAG: hypothetical protein EOO44_19970 [Flavobacterium sp.]